LRTRRALPGTATVFLVSLSAPVDGVTKEGSMSVIKVIELSSQSSESWEDATRQTVERASRSLRNIRSVWVKEFEAAVDADKVTQFRVILKISFQLEEGENMGDEGRWDLGDEP
jgi:flavin-binding protein dodecin